MHYTFRAIALTAATSLLGGCVSAINQTNAERYYAIGLDAEAAGNFAGAREAFKRAFINARSAGASPEYMSAVVYNLGRMYGYTCDYAGAELLLKDALDSERSLQHPTPGNITKRLSELARLTYDMQKYQDSVSYYDQAVPLLEELGMAEDDPVGYGRYLEMFAAALAQSGDRPRAESMRAKATKLLSEHPSQRAQFTPVLYSEVCAK